MSEDPYVLADALRQERIDGKLDQETFLTRMDALGPSLSEPPRAPSSSAEATARIDSLRQRRAAGSVSEAQFHEEMQLLGPIASPDTQIPPELQAQFDRDMSPPTDPLGYQFEYRDSNPTPEDLQWDQSVRKLFYEVGIPQAIAGPVHRAVEELGARLKDASPEALEQHEQRVGATMRERWGDQLHEKIARIDRFIDSLKGDISDTIRKAPWLIADPFVLSSLDDWLTYRESRPKS